MTAPPRQHVACLTVALSLLFAIAYVYHVAATAPAGLPLGWLLLLAGKTGIELVAGTLGIGFAVSAVTFVCMRDVDAPSPRTTLRRLPEVGIVYLCCDDADWSALESLTRITYEGPIHLVIHDDSRQPSARAAVDQMAARLMIARAWDVHVLRRPDKSGGKAGAVNYALDQTAHLYEFFLLCDNDSTIVDPGAIQDGLVAIDAPEIAGVQFRSVPVDDPNYCGVNRRLADSILAFHAFLAPAARFGWMPFIGHNALLRTAAVQGVGGLTPGFFSDDLDLTVRLNLAGHRIVYAPHVRMGEKHPPSYTAFRKRSYKWAYGCIQTLRAHWWSVLTAQRLSFAEKLSFFQFAGFYSVQCLVLAYLCGVLLAAPLGAAWAFTIDPGVGIVVGTVLVAIVYAPLLATTRRRRRAGGVDGC